jgi:hypothetical protein
MPNCQGYNNNVLFLTDMLIFLLVLSVLITFLDLLGLQIEAPTRFNGWRVASLQTALVTGVFIALQSEILGLFNLLALPYVAGIWGFTLLLSTWLGWRKGWLQRGWLRLMASVHLLDWFTIFTLVIFSSIFASLLVVALIAPTNNVDSLNYHMSRVMHWIQDRNLGHYPVAYEPQLTNQIGAELIILQLRLLMGNDRLANLPQWSSLIISAIAISLGAKLLGARRKGQLAAAAFGISIPMGLLQATSAQNDYVSALWLIILAVFILYTCQQEPGWAEIFSISAALGLGLLTKGTFYSFAIPWGIWLIIHWIKQRRFLEFLKRGMVIALIVIVLNLGYWTRNINTYGGPFGPTQWVNAMTSMDNGLKPFTSNLVKYVVLNFATPSPRINNQMASFIRSYFPAYDLAVDDFHLDWRWNSEDNAGSPIHVLLVMGIMVTVFLLFVIKRLKRLYILWYCLAAFFSYVTFVLIVHFDQSGVRLELPLLIIWAPVFGIVINKLGEKWLAPVAIVIFFMISLPYVFFNTTRPLIAMKNEPELFSIHPFPGLGETKSSSIFFADQRELLFINRPELNKPYMEITHDIRNSGCAQVGLRIDSHDPEYTFWWLLNAPQSGIRIESVYYSDNLICYADLSFKPCAIICTICGERTRLHGLDLSGSYGENVKLFLGNSFSPLEDK